MRAAPLSAMSKAAAYIQRVSKALLPTMYQSAVLLTIYCYFVCSFAVYKACLGKQVCSFLHLPAPFIDTGDEAGHCWRVMDCFYQVILNPT
jgi:hypothetical protein